MAELCAAARECLLLAHLPRQAGPSEMRAVPRQRRRRHGAAPVSAGPDQRLLARHLGAAGGAGGVADRRRNEDGRLRGLPPPAGSGIQLPGVSQMTTTRRNLLKFVGGGAAGALLTPAPWRLITDTALWSENWPGIPRPARGEIRARFTHCTLCPAGCAVRARCVGGQPVSLTGVKPHPIGHGALCPWGLVGHQLPYHPARIRQGPVKEAIVAVARAIAQRGAGERVAVLDLRPGRTVSWTYRRAMAVMAGGLYLTPFQPAYAIDLAAARTVVSFGAPLFDGWGTPGNVFAARANFRLIQVEPVESRTAALADIWLPIRPGTESAIASALTGEIAIAEAARATGVDEKTLGAAKEAMAAGPVLA